ncbi:hypothetical protein AB0758_44045 [Tolypothrix bouteillei VB521301_2]|uniref:Uncharacterized protein n=1 Tax=Tolypothrix bouteillei VB521301 TaxID=1479485 RepID=A0A0C1NCQ9_9CYAN
MMTQLQIKPAYIGFVSSTYIERLNLEPGIQLANDELFEGKHMYTIDTRAYKPLDEFGIDDNDKLKILLENKGFKEVEIIQFNDRQGFTRKAD